MNDVFVVDVCLQVLMTAAVDAGCQIYFNHPLAHIDIERGICFFYLFDRQAQQLYQKSVQATHVFGADGGGSRCRQALKGLMQDVRSV